MQRKIYCKSERLQCWNLAATDTLTQQNAHALGKYIYIYIYTSLRNHPRLALTLTITSFRFAAVSQKQPDQPKYVFIRKPNGLRRWSGLASFPGPRLTMIGCKGSLVPRPSPAPVFDRLPFLRSKTGAGEGLGTRLSQGWATRNLSEVIQRELNCI